MAKPKIRWYGNNSSKTREMYYAHQDQGHSLADPEQRGQLSNLIHFLQQLDYDGEVQLVCSIIQKHRQLIAYRFTSDGAYNRHHGQLFKLAPSIERGVFDPFRWDKYQFNLWFLNEDDEGESDETEGNSSEM